MSLISSPQNERVKRVRQLQRQAKARRKQRRLVLEGLRLVEDALRAGVLPDYVLFTADMGDALARVLDALDASGVPHQPVTAAVMREMADTETPQGIVGVFPWPDLPIPPHPDLIIVADGWRDPGNLGTMIRTAAAAGIDAIALTPGTVDPFNPKTLRAGMGGHFRVPVVQMDWPELIDTFPHMALVIADASGMLAYDKIDWTSPSLVVVGGEAHGLSEAARNLPHIAVTIPMASQTESLNAAMTAGILMYEAQRQRRQFR